MIKNIYAISLQGSITHYAEFFYCVLIPLIHYDISTNGKHTYNIKINLGSMLKILNFVFPNRITTDYISDEINVSDKYTYYNLYIQLKRNPQKNDILLESFDIFNNTLYVYLTPQFNNKWFQELEQQFIEYQYQRDKKQSSTKFKPLEKSVKENKNRFKQLEITHKFLLLKEYMPAVKHFFNGKIQGDSKFKIILIERKFSPINPNIANNYAGQRRLIYNHQALKKKLSSKYGNLFINVCLEEINVFEQYHLFTNAQIVIGQHGAGLANIFFMENGFKSTLIEISPEWNIGNNWFKNISHFCDINYIPIHQKRMTEKEWKKLKIDWPIDSAVFTDKDTDYNIESSLKNIKNLVLKHDLRLKDDA
jgi:hypothetical protein